MKNNEVLTSLGNINKVPTGLRKVEKLGYKKVLNFGCGYGYKHHTKEMVNLELVNYDPYITEVSNLPEKNINIELVVCNNVLNVIEDDEVIEKVLDTIESYNKPVLITIYEGNKTGVGKLTSKGTYQRNTKSKDYQILKDRGYTYKSGAWTKGQ